MTPLDRVLRYAPPSYLLRIALQQLHEAQRIIDRQQDTILAQRDELRSYQERDKS